MTKLSWTILALLAGSFCFPMKSARAQQISGATINGEQTSLTLPAGKSIYLYGATNGGAYSDSGFAQGSYQAVVDTDGNVSAALAVTTSNSNTFTTSDQYYVIGGLGVTGFSNMVESYGSNTQSGASTASDTFTAANELSLVVFIGLASSQQSISLSGIPGLHVDATSSEPDAMIIAHAYLEPGQYTVTEHSEATAAGQDPDNMADLIGVFVFTPEHNTWSHGAGMPVALDETAVTVLDKEIYVIGGGNNSTPMTTNVQIYNPATNRWTIGPPLPVATGNGCAAVVKNVLYFFDGIIGDTGNGQDTSAVWAYYLKTKQWSTSPVAQMPTARRSVMCAAVNGVIYVMGGYDNGDFLSTVESYDPATNTPQTEPSLLYPESDGSAAVIGTTILVTDGSGGYTDGHNQEYNVTTNGPWTELASDPTLRQGTCTGSIGGRLYSAGGWNGSNTALSFTESYSLVQNAWTTEFAFMPRGTMGLGRSIAYDGKLYCFGGEYTNGGDKVRTVEIYQP
jgi:N-acetylneuraminic acid mutarotase